MQLDEICLYHIIDNNITGNCDYCTHDEFNKNCIKYYPVSLVKLDVKDTENETFK